MRATEVAHDRPPVNGVVIPDHKNMASKMVEEMTKKQTHVRLLNVLQMQPVVETEVFAARADRKTGDDGDPIMLLMMADDGGLAPGGPRPAYGWDQEKPGLVDEHQMGAQPRGVFFIRGHFVRFQCSMAASLCSKARLRGF